MHQPARQAGLAGGCTWFPREVRVRLKLLLFSFLLLLTAACGQAGSDQVPVAELPQPPQTLGDLQNISWKSVPQSHRLGDKSAVWKTTIGELFTPVWWLEFYQGHAYVRIGLLGFPDQIAPSIIYGLGDILASRLPRSVDTLRSDAATLVPTPFPPAPTFTPQASPASVALPTSQLIPLNA